MTSPAQKRLISRFTSGVAEAWATERPPAPEPLAGAPQEERITVMENKAMLITLLRVFRLIALPQLRKNQEIPG
jgi:hypothetical protein